ncbi:hypothetical protein AB672_02145 [Xylella taiwanensis]|nr:hypothetical protein AB672_02145 [Xylella taiwanensis]
MLGIIYFVTRGGWLCLTVVINKNIDMLVNSMFPRISFEDLLSLSKPSDKITQVDRTPIQSA